MPDPTASASDQPDPVVRLVEPELPEVRVLRVQPGDVLVLRVPAKLSFDQAARLYDEFRTRFPHNKIAVLAGADIAVLRTEPEQAAHIGQWERDLLEQQAGERS